MLLVEEYDKFYLPLYQTKAKQGSSIAQITIAVLFDVDDYENFLSCKRTLLHLTYFGVVFFYSIGYHCGLNVPPVTISSALELSIRVWYSRYQLNSNVALILQKDRNIINCGKHTPFPKFIEFMYGLIGSFFAIYKSLLMKRISPAMSVF